MLNQEIPEVLKYRGEFGSELVLFLPFVTWLSRSGLLAARVIDTYAGMACYYEHLGAREVRETTEKRAYVDPRHRLACLPIKDEHSFHYSDSRIRLNYPDLRRHFLSDLGGQDRITNYLRDHHRPLFVVHNKYAREWRGDPINFIDLDSLERIFSILTKRFQVLYVRHRGDGVSSGYSNDLDDVLKFDDLDLLRSTPGVLDFEDLFRAAVVDGFRGGVNSFKNLLYARSYHFMSVQGGGAHHCAMFSGSMLAVLHKRGREIQGAYDSGYYGFAANPPPVRLICRSAGHLLVAATVMQSARVVAGRAFPEPGALETFKGTVYA